MTSHNDDLSPLTAGGVENDPDSGAPEPVPAGSEGADSGASDAVDVDDTDSGTVPNQSPHNDIAGVGAPSGVGADSAGLQTGPQLDQNVASKDDKVQGILAQTRADVPNESSERIAEVLRQRFTDAGMTVSYDEIAQHADRLASE